MSPVRGHSSRARRAGDWLSAYPDLAVRRRLHRAPIVCWRLGLGPLAGRAFLLLTTTGRNSGKPRRTVLTPRVVRGREYLWCPYGARSQWYRNLVADPVVTVQSRFGTRTVRAAPVEDDGELLAVWAEITRADPGMAAQYLESQGIGAGVGELLAHSARLHVVRLDRTASVGPPPQPRDLTWIWVLPAVCAFLGSRRRSGVRLSRSAQ